MPSDDEEIDKSPRTKKSDNKDRKDRRDDSYERRRQSRSRSRKRSRSRERRRSRSRKKPRSRSGSRSRRRRSRSSRRSRRNSRSNSRDRHRSRKSESRSRRSKPTPSPSRSLSPLSRRIKTQKKAQDPAAPKKFWDGFQWVERTPMQQQVEDAPSASMQQTRKDRRLYVGNLPQGCTTEQIRDFMNVTLRTCGAVDGSTNAVLSAWIAGDKKYSFIEFATPDCATIAMALDGVSFMGCNLRIKRPNTYATGGLGGVGGLM